jgi:hypothetical protein
MNPTAPLDDPIFRYFLFSENGHDWYLYTFEGVIIGEPNNTFGSSRWHNEAYLYGGIIHNGRIIMLAPHYIMYVEPVT